MNPNPMKTARGTITLVQEHRFQLRDDRGRHRLFILTQDARQEWSDLERLERTGQPVTVLYTHAGGVLAAAAHDVSCSQPNMISNREESA